MVLSWSAPLSDGGCPITGYSLFRDNGVTMNPIIEVNSPSDPAVRDIPTLRTVSVTLPNADLGKKFTFKLTAYNVEGNTYVTGACFMFAIVPPQPIAGPALVTRSSSSITVSYSSLLTGGSPLISYHLQYQDAYSGTWVDLNGLSNPSLLSQYTLTGLTKGDSYMFRFRAENEIGWSPYSDETIIVTADVPSQPNIPTLVEATDTTIELNLDTNVDNGGSPITAYTLEMGLGLTPATFNPVGSYTSGDLNIVLDGTDGITTGDIFSFRFMATNDVGDSIYSNVLSVSANDVLPASASITKTMSLSTSTSINVQWAAVPAGTGVGGTLTGYVLTV